MFFTLPAEGQGFPLELMVLRPSSSASQSLYPGKLCTYRRLISDNQKQNKQKQQNKLLQY